MHFKPTKRQCVSGRDNPPSEPSSGSGGPQGISGHCAETTTSMKSGLLAQPMEMNKAETEPAKAASTHSGSNEDASGDKSENYVDLQSYISAPAAESEFAGDAYADKYFDLDRFSPGTADAVRRFLEKPYQPAPIDQDNEFVTAEHCPNVPVTAAVPAGHEPDLQATGLHVDAALVPSEPPCRGVSWVLLSRVRYPTERKLMEACHTNVACWAASLPGYSFHIGLTRDPDHRFDNRNVVVVYI